MKTPTLLTILETALSCKAMSLSTIQPIPCTIIAILAKFMNPALNLVQSYISILLHAGHCGKQVCMPVLNKVQLHSVITLEVFRRLQKLMLCMSSDSTLKLIDTMVFSHDAAVFQIICTIDWRKVYQR